MIRYNNSTNQFEGYQAGAWAPIGGGEGGINYITDGTFESFSQSNWATYQDAAATAPVDGTGGSPTISNISQIAATTFRGNNHGRMIKSASAVQGQGWNRAFTIAPVDCNKQLTLEFDYQVASANYVDNDLRVFVYDITNSTLIYPAQTDIPRAGGSIAKLEQRLTLQTQQAIDLSFTLLQPILTTGHLT